MRLIDVDTVLDIIRDYFVRLTDKIAEEYGADEMPMGVINPYLEMNKELRTMVRQTPTVDVEPVRHGHWEEFHCSVCGKMGWDNEDKYCPNCGAKMDKIEEYLVMPKADGSTIKIGKMDEVEEDAGLISNKKCSECLHVQNITGLRISCSDCGAELKER